jgi:hypothetical protein
MELYRITNYLELIDKRISVASAIATSGMDEAQREKFRKDNPDFCKVLKKKRQNIRKDLTNKILFEITNLCVKHKVAIVAFEDFGYLNKDDDVKWKKRMRKLLRMKGFEKTAENRLVERGVLTLSVNPEHTSKLFKNKYWGVREKENAIITPYIDGNFAAPDDDDLVAAENILIRAFTRHKEILSIPVKWKNGKPEPVLVSKRKKGPFLRKYGIINKVVEADEKSKKLYFFENVWTGKRPYLILEERLASAKVVTPSPAHART